MNYNLSYNLWYNFVQFISILESYVTTPCHHNVHPILTVIPDKEWKVNKLREDVSEITDVTSELI